jgi:hypothetical protein
LPLAIAAHLHVPYRIDIGIEGSDSASVEDRRGKGKKLATASFPHEGFCVKIFPDCQHFSIARLPPFLRAAESEWCFDRQSRTFNPPFGFN